MIDLTEHAEGVVLPVRAMPGARSSGVRGEHRGALKVAVTQVAEKGKANDAVIEALAEALDLKRSQLALLSGQTQRDKRILVRNIQLADLAARVAKAVAPQAPNHKHQAPNKH